MIKVQVKDLLSIEPVLVKMKTDAEKNGLDFNLTYKLVKLINKLTPEYQEIYEQKMKIFNKFGTEVKDEEGEGSHITIPSEKLAEFNKYWIPFLELEVEIFNVFKFKFDELSFKDKYLESEVRSFGPFLESTDYEEEPEKKSKLNIVFDEDNNPEVTKSLEN